MDDFTTRRYDDLSTSFVDIYEEGNPFLAAKVLVEANIPEDDLPHLRELIEQKLLLRGWTFPEVQDAGC